LAGEKFRHTGKKYNGLFMEGKKEHKGKRKKIRCSAAKGGKKKESISKLSRRDCRPWGEKRTLSLSRRSCRRGEKRSFHLFEVSLHGEEGRGFRAAVLTF